MAPVQTPRRPKADEAYQDAAGKTPDQQVQTGPIMTCLPGAAATPDYEAVRQAQVADSVEKALAANPHGQLVAPGEELMVLPEPAPAAAEETGEEAPPPPTLREAGEGVKEEGRRLVAEQYGYMYDTGKALQILSSLWVSPDGMQVCFIHVRQLRTPARVEQQALQQMLSDVGRGRPGARSSEGVAGWAGAGRSQGRAADEWRPRSAR